MKPIGQFAKENNVTVKTLHYYEKLELITPSKVDPESGYRYYGENVKRDLTLILFLKELGLSLNEVRVIIKENINASELLDMLEFKKIQAIRDKESTEKRLHKLENVISLLEEQATKKIDYKELMSMKEKELFSGKYGRSKYIEESEKMYDYAKINGTPLSVIQMDLDHFYNVNKEFGFDVGDIVIERTQDEILAAITNIPFESMMERKGGDEFSVIINASPKEASKIATDILNRVCNVDYGDVAENLKVSITAGIAGLTKQTKNYAELVQTATIALFEQKKRRN